jgi:hypothetical protein
METQNQKNVGLQHLYSLLFLVFRPKTCLVVRTKRNQTEEPMVQDHVKLKNWQSLLDMFLLIKTIGNNMKEVLITEAMDCVIIEIYIRCLQQNMQRDCKAAGSHGDIFSWVT